MNDDDDPEIALVHILASLHVLLAIAIAVHHSKETKRNEKKRKSLHPHLDFRQDIKNMPLKFWWIRHILGPGVRPGGCREGRLAVGCLPGMPRG